MKKKDLLKKILKKDNINNFIVSTFLSISANGMLNSLLILTNDELDNIVLYSRSNDDKTAIT